jgi:hypothetical protein
MTDEELMKEVKRLQKLANESERKIDALMTEDCVSADELMLLELTLSGLVGALSEALKEFIETSGKGAGS